MAIVLSFFVGFICLFIGIGLSGPTSQPAQQSTATVIPALAPAVTPAPGPPGPSIEAVQQAQQKKQEAQQAVDTFTQNQKPFVDLYNNFGDEISGISDGSIDAVTGYSDLGKMNDQALNIYTNVMSMSVPKQYSDSKESLILAVSYLQNAISEAKNYMDDQKISHLANAKDDLQQAYNGNNIVSVAVLKQAATDGYTP
jgi:hypothetical protein